MSKLIIRQMEEKDIPQVYAIEKETFSMPWSKKAFAELEGEIAGYCGCYQSLEEAEITNVAVKRQLRGHGIGRRLLEELMRIGKERGAFAYTLEVRVSNQAAIHLYEKLGFISFGIRKNFYEKPKEDAMIMWRHWTT